jgi:hypothetical protein
VAEFAGIGITTSDQADAPGFYGLLGVEVDEPENTSRHRRSTRPPDVGLGESPPGQRFAYLPDPDGNIVALFAPL